MGKVGGQGAERGHLLRLELLRLQTPRSLDEEPDECPREPQRGQGQDRDGDGLRKQITPKIRHPLGNLRAVHVEDDVSDLSERD